MQLPRVELLNDPAYGSHTKAQKMCKKLRENAVHILPLPYSASIGHYYANSAQCIHVDEKEYPTVVCLASSSRHF